MQINGANESENHPCLDRQASSSASTTNTTSGLIDLPFANPTLVTSVMLVLQFGPQPKSTPRGEELSSPRSPGVVERRLL